MAITTSQRASGRHWLGHIIVPLLILGLGLGLFLENRAAGAENAGRPNFVIIFADDLGYADVGCFGARGWQTPNLDRMAKEGRRFTDFYVAQPVCSASRA